MRRKSLGSRVLGALLARRQERRRLFYNQLAPLFKKLHTVELVYRPSLESDRSVQEETADSRKKEAAKKRKEK